MCVCMWEAEWHGQLSTLVRLQEAKEIGDDFLALEKYVNLNYLVGGYDEFLIEFLVTVAAICMADGTVCPGTGQFVAMRHAGGT